MRSAGQRNCILVATALLVFAFCLPAQADILLTLNESALQEAVALARSKAERVRQFLIVYQRTPEASVEKPFLSRVEVFTPFRTAVERAFHASGGYTFMQAREDYDSKNDRLSVQATILLPAGYVYNSATPLGTDWRVRVYQEGRPLTPVARSRRELYTGGSGDGRATMVGSELHWDYDIGKVNPAVPLRIKILSPGGHAYHAWFNLADLR